MVSVAAGGRGAGNSMAQVLQAAWAPDTPQAARLLNAALILCADHELNVSSFTARCVASAGATPYQVVIAGLAALQGAKHGRVSERVEAFLREVGASGDIRAVIAGRLKRGEDVPGFGHPLYPQGDPRGQKLLEMTTVLLPGAESVGRAQAVAAAVLEMLGQRPTVDFGLVTAAQALNLPPGSALALFALGRTIGWIGHALEAYQSDRIIRPRARYVGVRPEG